MIRINQHCINRFKMFSNVYNYMVSTGVWLTFDKNTLEYIGINVFYTIRDYISINNKCEKKIHELISKGILEVID